MGRKNGALHNYTPIRESFKSSILKNNKTVRKSRQEVVNIKSKSELSPELILFLKEIKEKQIFEIPKDFYKISYNRIVKSRSGNLEIPSIEFIVPLFQNIDISKSYNRLDFTYNYLVNNTGKNFLYLYKEKADKYVRGLVLYNTEKAFGIKLDCNIEDVVLELLHFEFSESQLLKLFRFQKNFIKNSMTSLSGISSFSDFMSVLNCVQKNIIEFDDILEYVKTTLFIKCKEYNDVNKFAEGMNISISRAEKCYRFFGLLNTNNLNKVFKSDMEPSNVVKVNTNDNEIVVNSQEERLLKIFLKEKADIIKFKSMVLKTDELLNFNNSLENMEDILFYYGLININKSYKYTSDFYPAEDKILELFYKEVGVKVLDIMDVVIPNYHRKPIIDYIFRVRELDIKTPHPLNSFDILEIDKEFMIKISKSIKSGYGKFLNWFDLFDLSIYFNELNLGIIKTKKQKEIKNLDDIDLSDYIKKAKKLKEVIYFDVFWTSKNHYIFKENFKNIGIDVIKMIPNLTVDACLKHSLQYKIYQNYTEEEVNKMKDVYYTSGLEGLIKSFPYRTKEALKYKIEEEGWESAKLNSSISSTMNKKIETLLEEYKIQYRDSIREEESEKIRKKVRAEEVKKIETEVTNRLKNTMEKDLTQKLRKEISKKIREDEEKRTYLIMRKIITETLSDLDELIPLIIQSSYVSDLPKKLSYLIMENMKEGINQRLDNAFNI